MDIKPNNLQCQKVVHFVYVAVLIVILAACAPGQAGNNPGPFASTDAPGSADTAGGPTPQIQPGGVSQTAEAPGSQLTPVNVTQTPSNIESGTVVSGTAAAMPDEGTRVATAVSPEAMAEVTAATTLEAPAATDVADTIPAPTVPASETVSAGLINNGIVQITISETIAPRVTEQIIPVQVEATVPNSETAPALRTLTGTIFLLGGFEQLDPNAAAYQQPRVLVMPVASYIPNDSAVVTPSLGNPFFDALRIATNENNNNQAIFSSLQLQFTGVISQSPALILRPGITVAFSAEPQRVDFGSGRGVRYVSALTEGSTNITSDNLYYFFHGLTDDNRYYVAAVIPIANASLVSSTAGTPVAPDEYDKYLKGVEEQIGNDEAFAAALANYDAMMSSIQVLQ